MKVSQMTPLINVQNAERSIEFYRDVVGFPLKFESPGWTEFATEGATLALRAPGQKHLVRREQPGDVRAHPERVLRKRLAGYD